MQKAIRPSNRVSVGSSSAPAQVRKCGKRRQGGAWVRTFVVQFAGTDAVRTVRGDLVRPSV